jgi:hypothetical protein
MKDSLWPPSRLRAALCWLLPLWLILAACTPSPESTGPTGTEPSHEASRHSADNKVVVHLDFEPSVAGVEGDFVDVSQVTETGIVYSSGYPLN